MVTIGMNYQPKKSVSLIAVLLELGAANKVASPNIGKIFLKHLVFFIISKLNI